MAKNRITAIVNTLNEEKRLAKCLASLSFCDEIVVVDMMSDDETVSIAKKYTKKIFDHKRMGYVEPARNFAIGKATGEYVLVVDADETIPEVLAKKLRGLADDDFDGYVLIPRSNHIFGGPIRHTGWWPDYNIRFFRAGRVKWGNKIHSVPTTTGAEVRLDADDAMAIQHDNYPTISSYLSRLDRYTTVQAKELSDGQLETSLFISKPWSEFLRRYFAMEGYKDGVRGLVLSILQALSEFIVVAKIWEMKGYPDMRLSGNNVDQSIRNAAKEYSWWETERKIKSSNPALKILLKIKRKL